MDKKVTMIGLEKMLEELYQKCDGYPDFYYTEEGNFNFTHRSPEGVAEEIIKRHFMETYGFEPKIMVEEWEYEKDLGEAEDGMPMIYIRVYRDTTVVLPTREECIALFKAGATFPKEKQTLTEEDLFYYCEVKSLLLAA